VIIAISCHDQTLPAAEIDDRLRFGFQGEKAPSDLLTNLKTIGSGICIEGEGAGVARRSETVGDDRRASLAVRRIDGGLSGISFALKTGAGQKKDVVCCLNIPCPP
jgi:hypothetical protein